MKKKIALALMLIMTLTVNSFAAPRTSTFSNVFDEKAMFTVTSSLSEGELVYIGKNGTKEVEVTYTVTPHPIEVNIPESKDIVIAIDTSSSMKYYLHNNDYAYIAGDDTAKYPNETRIHKVVENAKHVVEELSKYKNTRISIIDFNTYARSNSNGLKSAYSQGTFLDIYKNEGNVNILKEYLDDMEDFTLRHHSRGTNMGDGLRLSYSKLMNMNDHPNSEKYMIFMTDGSPSFFSANHKNGPSGGNQVNGHWVNDDIYTYIDKDSENADGELVERDYIKLYNYERDKYYYDWLGWRRNDGRYHVADKVSDKYVSPSGVYCSVKNFYTTNHMAFLPDLRSEVQRDFHERLYSFLENNNTDNLNAIEYARIWLENIKDSEIHPYYINFRSNGISTEYSWAKPLDKILEDVYSSDELEKGSLYWESGDEESLARVYDKISKEIVKSAKVVSRLSIVRPDDVVILDDPGTGEVYTKDLDIEYVWDEKQNAYTADPVKFVVKYSVKVAKRFDFLTTFDFKFGTESSFTGSKKVELKNDFETITDAKILKASDANLELLAQFKDEYFVNNDIEIDYTITKKIEDDENPDSDGVVDLVVVLQKGGFQWNYYVPHKYDENDTLDLWGVNEYGNTTKNNTDLDFALDVINRFKDNKNVRVGLVSYANLAEYHYYDNGQFFSDLTTEAARKRFMENVKATPKCYIGINSVGNMQSNPNVGDGLRLAYYKLNENNNHKKHLLYMGDGFAEAETWSVKGYFRWKDKFYYDSNYDDAFDSNSSGILDKYDFDDYFWFKIKGVDYKDQESLYLNHWVREIKNSGINPHYMIPLDDHGSEGSIEDYTHTLSDPFNQDNGNRLSRLTSIGAQVGRIYGFTKDNNKNFDIAKYKENPKLIYRNGDEKALFDNFKLISDDINNTGGKISDIKLNITLPEGMEIKSATSEGEALEIKDGDIILNDIDKTKKLKIVARTPRPDKYMLSGVLKYKKNGKDMNLPFLTGILNVKPINEPTILMSQMPKIGKKNTFTLEDNGSSAIVFKDKDKKLVLTNPADSIPSTIVGADGFSMRIKANPFELEGGGDIFETDNFKVSFGDYTNKDGESVSGAVKIQIGAKEYVFGNKTYKLNENSLKEVFIDYDKKGNLNVYIDGVRFKRKKTSSSGEALPVPDLSGTAKIGGFKGLIKEVSISSKSHKYSEIKNYISSADYKWTPDNIDSSVSESVMGDDVVVFKDDTTSGTLKHSIDDAPSWADYNGEKEVNKKVRAKMIIDGKYESPISERLSNVLMDYLDYNIL